MSFNKPFCKRNKARPVPIFPSVSLFLSLLLALMVVPTLATEVRAETLPKSDGPQLETPLKAAENDQSDIQDWREALLGEMTRLANELEQQRHFNNLLRDRIDILSHRIEQLEVEQSDSSEGHSALSQPPAPKTLQPDTPNDKQNESKSTEKALPDEFEQFLDLGEAMMRRFFGVVKEFRKEFEDNRV